MQPAFIFLSLVLLNQGSEQMAADRKLSARQLKVASLVEKLQSGTVDFREGSWVTTTTKRGLPQLIQVALEPDLDIIRLAIATHLDQDANKDQYYLSLLLPLIFEDLSRKPKEEFLYPLRIDDGELVIPRGYGFGGHAPDPLPTFDRWRKYYPRRDLKKFLELAKQSATKRAGSG
jgi:hypothetical protein